MSTMSPPRIHAAKTSLAEPTARAMSLATRKTPVPMVSPITMAVADQRPRPRTKWDRSALSARLSAIAHGIQSLLGASGLVNQLHRHSRGSALRRNLGCAGFASHLRAIIEALWHRRI